VSRGGDPASRGGRGGRDGHGGRGGWGGWGGAGRELAVAGLLALALTTAAWALGGPAVAGFVLVACVALSLVALRALVEPPEEPPQPESLYDLGPSRSFVGFWRTRSDVADASRSLSAWDLGLRPRLTNLLAARLSERHGISLADDPQAASDLLAGSRHDLWHWIDPQRQMPPEAASRPGIPPNVLAALIDRLEKL
jgi:hypothetical protein